VVEDEDTIEVIGPAENFKIISDLLRGSGVKLQEAGLRMIPNQEMELDIEQTLQVLRTVENIEELDDVQNVLP